MDTNNRIASPTTPRLLRESEALISVAKQYSASDIQSLMKVSEKIAQLNYERFQNFSTPFTAENAKPCALAFKGDVYDGLDADTLDEATLTYAQPRMRILSGLYGLLRPLDLMQPYRMEMGRKIATDKAKDLYGFWGNQITDLLNADAEETSSPAIINLASQEYAKAIQHSALSKPFITVHFKEKRGEEYKVLGLYAKRARGMMAHYILQNRVERIEDLYHFSEGGYYHATNLSDATNIVFVR